MKVLFLIPLLCVALAVVARRLKLQKRWGWPVHLDMLALALLGILNIGFFWQVAFKNAFLPLGGGDLASFLYPRYVFAASALRQGTLPLWNPYLYGGQPYLADVQSSLFYPPNLLAFLLNHPFSYSTLELLAMAHYWLAAVAMYVLCRRLSLSAVASLVGAVVWGWSGFLVAHLGHYNMISVAAWLPLILALLYPALRGGSLLWTIPAAAVLSLAIFAGHTQLTLYTFMAVIIFGLVWGFGRQTLPASVANGRPSAGDIWWRQARHSGRALLIVAVTVLLAVGLSALQLLPSYELSRYSLRTDLSYADASAYSLLPQKLITLVVPHFYGRDLANYWGPSVTEHFGYVGILPLVLALVALILRRDRPTLFFAVLGFLGLLLALGSWTTLYGWLYGLVPGFDKLRAPAASWSSSIWRSLAWQLWGPTRSLMASDGGSALVSGSPFGCPAPPWRVRFS